MSDCTEDEAVILIFQTQTHAGEAMLPNRQRTEKTQRRRWPARFALLLGATALLQAGVARALVWQWRFEAPNTPPHGAVLADGLLRTTDTPDGSGFFTILDASGQRNGVAITALMPTGSSIPGNAGFASDNLVRAGAVPMTSHGFNVSYADGSFSNFFTATFLTPVVDMDFHSVPPNFAFEPGTERPGVFSVRQVPVPGPLPLAGASLALAWSRRLRGAKRSDLADTRIR
jgi:hypothetical protein